MLLSIHVAAGALAIILGATALSAKKGGTLHRRAGLLFVVAMVLMGASASVLAFRKSPSNPNVIGGVMTLYFVGTALTTVRARSTWTRTFDSVMLAAVTGMAILDVIGALKAMNAPRGMLNGVPFPMFFFLAFVKLLAASGDLRLLVAGKIGGRQRLARHLWRMCFALFIAAGSFLSIRERVAKVLPEPLTSGPMRALPIVLLFGVMFYWLGRVRGRRPAAVLLRSTPLADSN